MNDERKSDTLTDADVSRLRDLRLRLLRLHKSLLDMERVDFEKIFGRVNSGELLQLTINNSQFAWLRMLSALVVEIDEILDEDESATSSNLDELIGQAKLLFTAPEDEEFKKKYQAALQREPTVVMAHSQVVKLLRELAKK